VLLFAPGGLRSAISWWHPAADGTKRAWMDPTVALANFRVIAMDQRNADRSRAPIRPGDGWQSYAGDHLALMDHLGHKRFHTMGGCIGSSFCLSLCEMAPERVTAAVLQNPIGFANDNRDIFKNKEWAAAMLARDKNLDQATLDSFFDKMFGGAFTFNTTPDFVRRCQTPLLVMPGDDPPHPKVIGEEIAKIAPNVEVLRDWKGADKVASVTPVVIDFLKRNTPK
jgi:pimeloyl-ACP methyl ester carboxylesterase